MNDWTGLTGEPGRVEGSEVQPVNPLAALAEQVYAYPEYRQTVTQAFGRTESVDWYGWSSERPQPSSRPDSEVFNAVLRDVYHRLRESDTIKQFRHADYIPKSAAEIEALFRVYDQALKAAVARQRERGAMSDRQKLKVDFAASEQDYGLRSMMKRHVMELAADGEPSYVLHDFFRILNPELRFDETAGESLRLIKKSTSDIPVESVARQIEREHDDRDDRDRAA